MNTLDMICQDVLCHCGPVRPRDDMTFLVLARPTDVAPAEAPAAAEAAPAATGVPLPRWS